MNMTELDHALRKLRLSGMADTLEARLIEAQTNKWKPMDLVSAMVADELVRREDRRSAAIYSAFGYRQAFCINDIPGAVQLDSRYIVFFQRRLQRCELAGQ